MSGGRELLVRVGVASVAAGVAGLTVTISLCAWVLQGGEPAAARARADSPAATGAVASFSERFSFTSIPASGSLEPAASFEDRFGAAAFQGSTPVRSVAVAPRVRDTVASAAPAAEVAPPARAPRIAAVPVPRPAPRYRVASLTDTPPPSAAYAPPESANRDSGILGLVKKLTVSDSAPTDAAPKDATKDEGQLAGDLSHTAIYDISARTVYLPNGEWLEAHSGLGGNLDDVRSVHLKSQGPTPPNVYELKLREAPFHGVQAIRLIPVDGSKMYGRAGMLVHPFMLGPDGASNGCVSLKDYPAFLKAYQRGEVTRMVVVEQLDDPPGARTAANWFSNTLKRIFGRS